MSTRGTSRGGGIWPSLAFGLSGKFRAARVGLLLVLAVPALGQPNTAAWEGPLAEARRLAALHAKGPYPTPQFPDCPSVGEVEFHFLKALLAATNAFQTGQIDHCTLAVILGEYAWFLHFYGTADQRRAADLMVSNAWHACPTNPVLAYKYAGTLEKNHRALVYAGKEGNLAAAEQALAIGQRLVKEHPGFVRGWLGLADQMIFRGQTEQGKTYLKKYLELTENETNLLADLELVGYREEYLRNLRRSYAETLKRMK